MAEFPVPLDNLIAYVKAMHPDGGPLENVSDAFTVSARLDEQSDALIGYFVDQARKSGAPWSQIGAAMGVTKQAAQKRFVSSRASDLMAGNAGQPFSRFTPRAASVLAAADRLAADGAAAASHPGGQGQAGQAENPPAGPAHLAAALLSEPESLAAKAIAAAGLTAEQVYAAVGAGPASQVPDVDSAALLELTFDPAAKEALKGALKSALRLNHNYIGTEHLLLGVLSAGGPVTEAFSALGLTPQRGEQLITAEIAAFQARREVHRHRSVVSLPDGTKVTAVSFDAIDPYARDRQPDYGLYFDRRWQPPWVHDHLDWPDFGVPDDQAPVLTVLRSVLDRARAGERVEVGCLGGHGRTGTALACLAILAGHPAAGAVAWVRASYCPEAVETADQEAFITGLRCWQPLPREAGS